MKNLIIILVVLFSGCQLPTAWQYKDPDFQTLENIDTIESAWLYVSTNIDRVYDWDKYNVSEYWQYPSETYSLGSGDCEDMVLLFMHLTQDLGYHASMGVINHNGTRHAVMILDGIVYEAQQYGMYYSVSDLVAEYPYDEAFHLIESYRLGRLK